ncbi:MAG: T9SS type A sorting domain-containing protein [Candidatus Cloacimonetes bacterium]|nr:T9SS type A sorting domain-containing protein [Candidatus Cloacimonadota bacterium]
MKNLILFVFIFVVGSFLFAVDPTINTVGLRNYSDQTQSVTNGTVVEVYGNTLNEPLDYDIRGVHGYSVTYKNQVYVQYRDADDQSLGGEYISASNYSDDTSDNFSFRFTIPSSVNSSTTQIGVYFGLYCEHDAPPFNGADIYGDATYSLTVNSAPTNYWVLLNFTDDTDDLTFTSTDYNSGTAFAPGSLNNAFYRLKVVRSGSGQIATISSMEFDLTGNFDSVDIDKVKLWRSANDTFEASSKDTEIYNETSLFDPFGGTFASNQEISANETVYYFITVDVDQNATETHEIGASLLAATDISSSHPIEGGFPLTGGDHALPVILSELLIEEFEGYPVIKWTTESEVNNSYWNIYRSISENLGQSIKLNVNSIEGQGTTFEPTSYQFVDYIVYEEGFTYYYWLESVDLAGEIELFGPMESAGPDTYDNLNPPVIPHAYGLFANYPNPFNPSTFIFFRLKESAMGTVSIYNLKGQKMKTIFEGDIPTEQVIRVSWDGKDKFNNIVASGFYFAQLKTNSRTYSRRIMLVK